LVDNAVLGGMHWLTISQLKMSLTDSRLPRQIFSLLTCK